MKTIFVIAIVLLVDRLNIYVRCKLILRHPELIQHYKELRRSTTHSTAAIQEAPLQTFSKKGKGFVRKQCVSLIKVDTVQLLEDGEPMPDAASNRKDDHFTEYSVKGFMRDQTGPLRLINLPIADIEGGVEVLQCAHTPNKSLYIENGTDSDEYFVFTTVEGNEAEPLVELAIRSAFMAWSTYNSRVNVSRPSTWNDHDYWYVVRRETQFLSNQRKVLTPAPKEISNVKDIYRFKLCSLLYTTWMQPIHPGYPIVHSIRRFQNTYENTVVLLLMNTKAFEGFAPEDFHPVNVIPCAVNAEWDKPSFYVAADPKLNETVNILSTVEGCAKAYVLVMRVNQISFLSQQFWEQFN